MAMKGNYRAGKSSSIGGNGVTHNAGKRTPSTFSKVTASAGKSSGLNCKGDPKGCAPMGKGGKSC